MPWLIAAIIITFCVLLSKIEDYSYFDFDNEAIFIGKRKIVTIKYNMIRTIDRNLMVHYESSVSYIYYHFYYVDDKGSEVKFSLQRSFRDKKKWEQFKTKLLYVNPQVIINEDKLI